jgi:hypothetical protein
MRPSTVVPELNVRGARAHPADRFGRVASI